MTLPLRNKKQQLVSMAKEAKDDDDNLSASFSWWSDSHNRPHNQSPWLKSIFSDLDDKIKTILNIIQDDGDSFTERAEIFYKRRPELLQILHDLHNSYHSLSQNYDQLRSPLQISTDVAGLQSDGQDEGYHHMTVSKLIEDNRRQQAELIRRNDEKRLVIKQLRAQVSRLMDENRALMSRLPSYKVDLKRSESTSFSKIKGLNCIGNFHD